MYEHTLVPFRDLLYGSYLILWLQVLIPEIILSQKHHINYVKSYTFSISRKLMRNKNKQRSFIAKYTTLFERTTCSFSAQPGMPVNWMNIMCQSNRIVLCMDCSIHCDNTVLLHLPNRPKTMELWSGLVVLWSAWSIHWTGKWWWRCVLLSWLKWGGAAEYDFHSQILSLIFCLEASGFPQTLQANVGNLWSHLGHL